MKKFKSMLLAMTFASVFLLTSCGGGNTTPPANTTTGENNTDDDKEPANTNDDAPAAGSVNNPAPDENVLYVGTTKHNGAYNYIYASSSYDVQVCHLVYDNVIDYSGDGIAKPGRIVENIDISDDGLVFTVKLRDGITFSNGAPMTANDVLFTYKVLADPSCTAYRINKIDALKGAKDYFSGQTEEVEFCKVIDDLTYEVHFTENLRTNWESLQVNVLSEAHFPGWEKGKSEEIVTAKHADPLGSGPYVLDTYEPSQFTSLKLNENYWAAGETDYQIEQVVIKFVETTTQLDVLVAGEVDILPSIIDRYDVERVKFDEDGKGTPDYIELLHYKRSAFGYVLFNNDVPSGSPSSDKLIRQAVTHAIDRELFVEQMYGDYAITLDVPMSQASSIYEKVLGGLTKYPYDLDRAEELIQEAGYEKVGGTYEKDGKKLEFKFLASTGNTVVESLLPVMQDSFSEIGMSLNVTQLEFASLLDIIQSDSTDWDLGFLASSWTSDEPNNWYGLFYSGMIPTSNSSRFNNPKFDELIVKGQSYLDLTAPEAIECYSEIAMLLNEEMPLMPLYANTLTAMVNKRVQGVEDIGTFTEWSEVLDGAYIEGYKK